MENIDTTTVQTEHFQEKPNNYMPLTIVATLVGCCSFFCIGFILGIVGIYFSSQVNSKFDAGDYEGAQKASKNAKLFALIAIGLFFVSFIYQVISYSMNPDLYMEQFEEVRRAIEEVKAAQN